MESRSTTRIVIGFLVAFLLIAGNAALSYITLSQLSAANRAVVHTEQTLRLLTDLSTSLLEAEVGQRGYVLTGEERYLEPYIGAHRNITSTLERLAQQGASPETTSRIAALETLVAKKFDELNAGIAARRSDGARAPTALALTDSGRLTTERLRRSIADIQSREETALGSRLTTSDFSAYLTSVGFVLATFLNLCLLGIICSLVLRGLVARKKAAATELEFNKKVELSLAEAQERTQEITFLSQMSSFLQTCTTSEEACMAIARFGPQVFPTESGVLYLFHASRNYVEHAASWGGSKPSEEMFPPTDCWALRRGRLHAVGAKDTALVCAHASRSGQPTQPYICAPMMAQGETLGLLFLQSQGNGDASAQLSESKQQLAATVAEQIALALANLRLRETLRQQSVCDPLTGLYNRRFLEESLDRELTRLERKNLPLSLIMIDVDHFKAFNDTFGHEAGDAVLRDLGGILQRLVRSGDIACRYGGEELTIILPEASVEIGRQRAEILREAVHELRLVHGGKSLGAITLSLGIACFPEHGRRREHLLQAADKALYEAKDRGRNCVVVSGSKMLKVVESSQRDQSGR